MKLATRLYLTIAAVLVTTFLVLHIVMDRTLARFELSETARRLEQSALMARALVADRTFDDAMADRLGSAVGLRVTLIGPTGRVLGDSEVESDRLASVENHADRPEVRAALAGRTGVAERASRTIARSLLYIAVPASGGVIRLAAPREEVRDSAARASRASLLVLIGTLVLLYPGCLVGAKRITARMERLASTISKLSDGDLGARTGIRGADAVSTLSQAVDRLGDSLEAGTGRDRQKAKDLRALFDSLDEGLAFIDRTGTLQLANPAFRLWTGGRHGVGARVGTLFRSPKVLGAIDSALARHSVTEELELGKRTVLISASPHRGGALLVVRDLTTLRRLEGVRQDFVSNVSHELKTPLTSVVGFAEAIAGGDLPDGASKDFGTRIVANASRMRRLVDDLLDLALVESGSWSPTLEPVAIGATAHEVWEELTPDTGGGEVGIEPGVTLEVEDPVRSVAHADVRSVHQILRNLVSNAARYAPEGTQIRVRVAADGAFVRTEVIDEGPGIPSPHVDRVFERFYRVDPSRSREEGGTGLGLSIVKHLVAAHGGEVGIQSAVSRGTTVWFTLPASIEPS